MKPNLVVVGLGNPGAQYVRTRHNLGFRAVEILGDAYGEGEWREVQKFSCRSREARVVTAAVLLVQPLTYMNRSGECIRKLVDFYKIDPKNQVLVLSDDIDLPLGEVRVRMKGGPGTHNGLKSVVAELGEEFPRMRIGLGTPQLGEDLAAWVLSALSAEEEVIIDKALRSLPERLKSFILETPAE